MPGLMLPRGGGFWDMSQRHQGMAIGAYQGQRPKQETTTEPPGKTAGGALSSGAGYGLAGYQLGSMIGAGTTAGTTGGIVTSSAGAGLAAGEAAATGGAVGGGVSGAATGSSAGPWGAVIGAGIGILSYLLS